MSEQPLLASATLTDAIRAIESTHRRIAVVVDNDRCIAGTLTDGDIRRCLLDGGDLNTTVDKAMHTSPITVDEFGSDDLILELMRSGNIEALPVVDSLGRFLRIVHITDVNVAHALDDASQFSFAVIMAGGEGMRLRPITETIPKPMVKVGGMPLIEHQIRRLARAGVKKVYIAVNYLSHVIEDYFENGQQYKLEIRYLKEKSKLGTAGALSLIPEPPRAPFAVMNGDILSTCNLGALFEFHSRHNAAVTVAAIDYLVNIPFGVIQARGVAVTALQEKPSQRFLCNAGIYVLSPSVFDLIPAATHWNMTDLINSCLSREKNVAVFPVHEYWSDVGTPDDLRKARDYIKSNRMVYE